MLKELVGSFLIESGRLARSMTRREPIVAGGSTFLKISSNNVRKSIFMHFLFLTKMDVEKPLL